MAHEWKAGDVIDWYGGTWTLWEYDFSTMEWGARYQRQPAHRAWFTPEMLARVIATHGGKCPVCDAIVAREEMHLCGPEVVSCPPAFDGDPLYKVVKAQYDGNRGRLLTMEQGPGIAALTLPPARQPYVCAVSDEDCLGVDVP